MARILVVDDEKHIREWYGLEFSELGHEVSTVASCFKLLDKIEMIRPELIILDIKLVDCDGLQMLQEIRGGCPDLPVILCTAYDSYRESVKTLAADYYVVKSYDLTELKAKVEAALAARVPVLNRAV